MQHRTHCARTASQAGRALNFSKIPDLIDCFVQLTPAEDLGLFSWSLTGHSQKSGFTSHPCTVAAHQPSHRPPTWCRSQGALPRSASSGVVMPSLRVDDLSVTGMAPPGSSGRQPSVSNAPTPTWRHCSAGGSLTHCVGLLVRLWGVRVGPTEKPAACVSAEGVGEGATARWVREGSPYSNPCHWQREGAREEGGRGAGVLWSRG